MTTIYTRGQEPASYSAFLQARGPRPALPITTPVHCKNSVTFDHRGRLVDVRTGQPVERAA